MAGPWELFAPQVAPVGPWSAFAPAAPRHLQPGENPDGTFGSVPEGAVVHHANGFDEIPNPGKGQAPVNAKRDNSSIETPDQDYHQQVQDRALIARANGADTGFTAPILNNTTFGLGDKAEALMRGVTQSVTGQQPFQQAYDTQAEIERQSLAQQERDHPNRTMAIALASSILPALATEGVGLTAAKAIPEAATGLWGLVGRLGASGLDNAVMAGVQGAANADNPNESRIDAAAQSAMLGGLLGVGLPVAGKTFGLLGGNKILSAVDPTGAAATKLAEVFRRAGMTPEQAAQAVEAARADGQDVFTAADALGNAGQRMLTGAIRQPGEERQVARDFLVGRQMDAGNRVAGALQDASGSTLTAAQTEDLLRSQRAADAFTNYAPVKADTSAFDPSPAVSIANQSISPLADRFAQSTGAVPTDLAIRAPIEASEAAIRDPIRSAIVEARSYLAAPNLTGINVEKAFRAKVNIDTMIAKATADGRGALVAELTPIRDALDAQLARTSQHYAAARDTYHQQSGVIDAVQTGRDMARGPNSPTDNINRFGTLEPSQADAARVGYFDPKVTAALQTKGTMTNAARPLNSPAMRMELPVLSAPGTYDRLAARLGREETMHGTMAAALGGSRTAENLADMADMHAIDPGILHDLIAGHFGRAAMGVAHAATDYFTGSNAKVTDHMIRLLMERSPDAIRESARAAQMTAAHRQALARMLLKGVAQSGTAAIGAMTPR